MRFLLSVVNLLAIAALPMQLSAATIIDFEDSPNGSVLTTQYPQLTFVNTIVLTAGISLNEFEFPSHSGINVASDDGGAITIFFDSPVISVGAFFTYAVPLSLTAFDSSGNQVGQILSLFASNDSLFGDAGSSPNELLSVSFSGGISAATITGDPLGSSFVMDDLTFTGVPEPSSLVLVLSAAALLAARRKLV